MNLIVEHLMVSLFSSHLGEVGPSKLNKFRLYVGVEGVTNTELFFPQVESFSVNAEKRPSCCIATINCV